ncbi:MAG: hypothetical protein A2Y89_00440 [Chloroflexi bacterium RBG_13_51_18]|nr:MAG: hypothetical protein A2Y89_00440 [Chloroflexi bacterium RBG_13_51_18]
MYEIIDTFPAFLTYWDKAQNLSSDEQVEGWEKEYMASWPKLLAKQLNNYASRNLDWFRFARDVVFPHFNERLPAIQEARKNLLESGESIYSRAQKALDFKSDVIFVIYVGIGCGAGWVTTFKDSPAILFGLENIAECGWSNPEAIKGLIAHETGHLAHQHWRKQKAKLPGSGPWWQLYEEGFAQRCESLILGDDSFHQTKSDKHNDWLNWCRSHKSWLAAEYLKAAAEDKTVKVFFGSWFEIEGRIETGYFLGHEAIRILEKNHSLKQIALIDDAESLLKPLLQRMI